MKKILNEYRFTKLVNEFILDADKKHDVQLKTIGYSSTHPSTKTLKEQFREKYKRISITEVNRICKNCIKDKYLESVLLKSGTFKADGVCMTDKGEDLLDTIPYFPFIKIGLLSAILEKHGKVFTALIGIFVGLLGTKLIDLIKLIIEIVKEGVIGAP